MTIDPLFLALIATLPSLVTSAVTYLLARQSSRANARLQPTQIRAVEVASAQDAAETETISIGNSQKIYGAYKELTADMADMLRKQVVLEGRVLTLEQENDALTTRLTAALEEVAAGESRYKALDERTRDYPHRLELAEKEIIALKATIVQQSMDAAQVSSTASADADARRAVAERALIEAGGVPLKDTPPAKKSTKDADALEVGRAIQSGDPVTIVPVDPTETNKE